MIVRYWRDEQRQRVKQAALTILGEIGVQVTEPRALEMLHGAGARIDGDRARLPAEMVEDALRSAPGTITINGRTGAEAMLLGARQAYFGAHTDGPEVLDPDAGIRRPCGEADVVRHARLIDALPRLAFVTASGLVADRPAEIGDLVSLARCLQNSTKPVLAMPVTPRSLADCRDLAALAVGGRDALRRRPTLIVYAEPVSPLSHPDEALQKVMACAEHDIPLAYSGFAAMGGTAPMSAAAVVAQMCAESLSGLVLHQLVRPGAPFIFGGMASAMDMRSTVFSYGAPSFQRGNTLLAEMAHHFGLPNFGTAGTSDSQVFDGQAVAEATSSCLLAAASGADLVHDVGLLGNATVVMPEMIVATDEILAMVHHLLADVPVDDETLALDVLAEVGPAGQFVTHDHTYRRFRDVWYPDLFYRSGAEAWRTAAPEPFAGRVGARTRELLAASRLMPLPETVVADMEKIIEDAEEEHRRESQAAAKRRPNPRRFT